MLNHIATDASKSGLKKVAIVSLPFDVSSGLEASHLTTENFLVNLGIGQKYFSNQHAAREWFNL